MEDNKKLTAILYTDGSCGPGNPSFYAWGAHGYIFDTLDDKGVTKNKPANFLVTNIGYLDSVESAKLKNEELGLRLVDPIEYLDWFGSCGPYGTNNEAEILAYLNSLTRVLTLDISEVIFYTDSQYLLYILKDLNENPEWRSKNPENLKLWNELEQVLGKAKEKGLVITNYKIKGHSGNLGNEQSDRLANLGRLRSMKDGEPTYNFNNYNPKKYWKPDIERHPFLNFKQCFFTTNETNLLGRKFYTAINYKDEITVGKKMNNAGYSIIYPSKPIQILEEIKDMYKSMLNNHSIVSTIRLDNIYKNENFRFISRFGLDCLNPTYKNLKALRVINSDVVCNEINPPGLAFKALSNTISLQNILEVYLDKIRNNDDSNKILEFIDITDKFFDFDKKTTLKKDILNNQYIYKHKYNDTVHNKSYMINLLLGTDCIERNALKKIEGKDPKFYIVVRKHNEIKIEYSTLIHTLADDDIIVSCNFYANTLY